MKKYILAVILFLPYMLLAQQGFPLGTKSSDVYAFRNGLITVHDTLHLLIPLDTPYIAMPKIEGWVGTYYVPLSSEPFDTSKTKAKLIQNIAGNGILVSSGGVGKDTLRADTTVLTTLYQNSKKGALAGNNTWTGTNIFNLDLSTHGAFYSGVANSTSGGVYLYDASSSYTGLLTPTGLSANRQYLLPNKGGTVILSSDTASMLSPYQNHYSILDSIGKLIASTGFLYNDGSGNLSWMAGGGGGLSAVYIDTTHYTHWGIGHGDTVLIPASRIAMLDNANTFTKSQIILNPNSSNSYGSEMVTNGSLSSNITSWTAGVGWAWDNGSMGFGVGAFASFPGTDFSQAVAVTSGTYYKITANITTDAGGLTLKYGNIILDLNTFGGDYIFKATSTGTFLLEFADSINGFEGTINNVSMKPITQFQQSTLSFENSDTTIGVEIRSGGSGLKNTFVGDSAGYQNTTGNSNVANGYQALNANTTGSGNVANGYQALNANTTGGATWPTAIRH